MREILFGNPDFAAAPSGLRRRPARAGQGASALAATHGILRPSGKRIRAPVDGAGSVRKEDGAMLVDLIVWLIIGAIAGWLAGQIMKGYGFGLVGNIVVGIIGAIIAGWLLPRIGFVLVGGVIAAIINAVIGAVILLAVIGFFKKNV
jgi:uncharacterized membrane protein YeaQ/YmgE (transglycosylase-associated protein family)